MKIIYLITFLTISQLLSAQMPSIQMYEEYGGYHFQHALDIIPTSDGNYAFIGTEQQHSVYGEFWTVKIDPNGDTLWTHLYGDFPFEHEGIRIMETQDGGLVVVGTENTTSPYDMNDDDILMVKVDANGNFLWAVSYGGSNKEYPVALLEKSNGNILVIGNTSSTDFYHPLSIQSQNGFIAEHSSTGQLLQVTHVGGDRTDRIESAIIQANDELVLAGVTNSVNGHFEAPDTLNHVFVSTHDSFGTILQINHFPVQFEYGIQIVASSQSGYLLSQSARTLDTTMLINGYTIDYFEDYIHTTKLDDSFMEEWSQTYPANRNQYNSKLIATDFGYLMCGSHHQRRDTLYYLAPNTQPFLMAINHLGDTLWTHDTHPDTTHRQYDGLCLGHNNNVFVLGEVVSDLWQCQVVVTELGFISSLGVTANMEEPMMLFPNPSSGIFRTPASVNQISVYSLSGKCILKVSNTNEFDLSNFPSGVYLTRIETDRNTLYTKVVLE
jgi:hypothetical protein